MASPNDVSSLQGAVIIEGFANLERGKRRYLFGDSVYRR
jgi:hypothetical protein